MKDYIVKGCFGDNLLCVISSYIQLRVPRCFQVGVSDGDEH